MMCKTTDEIVTVNSGSSPVIALGTLTPDNVGNLATTQIYADVVSELKRDAAGRISLKVEDNSEDEDTAMPEASDNGDEQRGNETLAH